jgi:hypothetical protein
MSLIPPLRGTPLYRYIPGVGRAVAQDLTVEKYSTFGGNVFVVDKVYGNDSNAIRDPFNKPFLNLTTALSNAPSGTTVYLMPGTYQGPITLPANVCLIGNCVQNCFISASNVTSNTTLVTMGSNARVEFVTMNLTSSCNVNLTGVEFPTGTSTNAKLRTSVVNIGSSATGSNTIVGVLSAGTSDTSYNPSDAIRASTISVDASSSGPVRGLLVSGSNWFGIRTTNIETKGSGSNIIGVETTNAGAYASLKHSTIHGGENESTNGDSDIRRTNGTILIGFSDLVNNSAGGQGFSITSATPFYQVGTFGNFSSTTTYNLIPGVIKIGDLPLSPFQVSVDQNSILYGAQFDVQPAISAGASMTLNVYRNNMLTDFSINLVAGETKKSLGNKSIDFSNGDLFDARITVGPSNLNNYTAYAAFSVY